MSGLPRSALEIQAEGLQQGVAEDRDKRCAALRAGAASQARQIIAAAHAEARSRVRDAVAEERARFDQGLRQAEARAEIEARRQAQRESLALRDHMWSEIPSVLERRWREPALRRAWIEAAIAQAAMLLGGRPWIMEHGTECAEFERSELTAHAVKQGASAVDWVLNAALPAGLKIRAEHVCIDATAAGLLVQRARIESEFLAEYLRPAVVASLGMPEAPAQPSPVREARHGA
jgi:hypothetical protein